MTWRLGNAIIWIAAIVPLTIGTIVQVKADTATMAAGSPMDVPDGD